MTARSPHTPPPPSTRGAKPSRASRWQAAREILRSRLRQLPSPSAAPPPRLGRRGRVVTHSIAAVLIVGVCVVAFLGGRPAGQNQPARASTPLASAPPSASSASTGAASAGALLAQQAAAFLAAYFSWNAGDTDMTYAARWQPSVAPSARPALISSEPLLTLDNGTDAAASSPVPVIPTQAIVQQGTQARLVVIWTIQVLPEGGEGAAWQPRQVQAALSFLQQADGAWLVSALTWSSQNGGTR